MENSLLPGAAAPSPVLSHSEEYFGPYRDFWWDEKFLDLMAHRWQLGRYQSLLDVGCGQCHWSRLLVPRLAAPARVTAVDRDQKWSAGSEALVRAFEAHGAKLEFQQGDAHRLPFADNSFDVVTCQTVLIHLHEPLEALREMARVVKPGGIVICAEPCNLAGTAFASSTSEKSSVDERCDDFRYHLLCEMGKKAAGEGDSSLGSSLAHLFQMAGFSDVRSCLSDKTNPILPPYTNQEAAACIAEILDCVSADRTTLADKEADRWIAALNDASATAFVERYRRQNAHYAKTIPAMIQAGTYWDSGAAVMYLVSATK
jgi:SAM-dependent methyltransferase